MDLKKLDMEALQRYTSPQAIKDFDRFLDALPVNVGYNALIAAGLACLMGASAVWFSAQEMQKVSKLHSDLTNVQALQPPVPVLKYTPVPQKALKPLNDKIAATFKGIIVNGNNDGELNLTAPDTDYFPQFLAAISYLQRGGKNWKVKINTLCVGRDCKAAKLAANLKIEQVSIGEPAPAKDAEKDTEKDDPAAAKK